MCSLPWVHQKKKKKGKRSERGAASAQGPCLWMRRSTWCFCLLPLRAAGRLLSCTISDKRWSSPSLCGLTSVVFLCLGGLARFANTAILPYALSLIKTHAEFLSPPFHSCAIQGYLIPIPRLGFTGCLYNAASDQWLNGQPGGNLSRGDWLSKRGTSFRLLLIMKRENSFALNYGFSGRGEWSFGRVWCPLNKWHICVLLSCSVLRNVALLPDEQLMHQWQGF